MKSELIRTNYEMPAATPKAGLPRVVEILVAAAALIACAPLLALAAVVITTGSPGGVIFRQRRVGRGGKHFTMYKLRTMRQSAYGPQVTAQGDRRVTGVGRILRKTKVDELPELWNVLKGDMSLVGPRPEVPRFVNLKDPLWQFVLQTRPGLTDPVALRLRNEEELLASAAAGDHQRFYIETLQPYTLHGYTEFLQRRTWLSDVKVLCQTGVAVFLPNTVAPPTLAEMTNDRSRGPA